jgi:flagellar hook-basal body complex protein FliE
MAIGGVQPPAASSSASGFTQALADGVRSADAQVSAVDALPSELVAGRVSDFHEIAAQIKQSELTFKFALEVRNKLIDAYRETMRMSV